jgi:moderate conductance mechanosensitive channel
VIGPVLAQASVAAVCGEGEEQDWFCAWMLETTGNELAARLSFVATTAVRVLLIVVLALVASRLLSRLILRFAGRMEARIEQRLERAQERGAISDTQRFRGRRLQRLHAITGAMRGVVGTIVWLVAVLLVLGELGIRIQPILAGAGLAGIVIGFGAQQLVRDVLAGIAMLIEDQYGVGDWIEVEGKMGQVERVGLRSTAFRDIDGVVHHVLNGSIQRVGNLSQEWARATFDVPLALDADVPAAKRLIHRVATELTEDGLWSQDVIGPPEIWGVQSFGPAGLTVRVVIPTKPLRNWDVTRQLRERLKLAFEEAGVRMPSQLVELGGQRFGYPLVAAGPEHLADAGGVQRIDADRSRDQRDDEVPPDGRSTEAAAEAADRDATAVLDLGTRSEGLGGSRPGRPRDAIEEHRPRDATEELRIVRGPQPRPD